MTERWNLAAAFLAGACLLKIYPLAIALLLIVAYPRPLGWRFVLAVGVGLAAMVLVGLVLTLWFLKPKGPTWWEEAKKAAGW